MTKLRVLRSEFLVDNPDDATIDYLIRGVLGLSTAAFLGELNSELTSIDENKLRAAHKRLSLGESVQYITGSTEFFGRKFEVDSRVLIPRQETAELVEFVLKQNKKFDSILDVGTGSGILAVTLAKEFPESKVKAVDISRDALDVAKKNAELNNANVDFVESDLLEEVTGTFDLIVSNPPYIADDDPEVEPSVDQNEPHLALYAGSDGLDIYRRLIPQTKHFLSDDGIIVFEIGYKQALAVSELIKESFPNSEPQIIKDFYGKDRFIAYGN
ncbi:MAG: peptide chain release factor N(5)-glutamine methyltransferase [Lactobacillaceae bacterium]|jgi:release factor glutamine methyltransferase|nr:peptide chain release factor N(5)-glutamine methyltransferase [Lactobacillaceae bacterium]